jgi:Domain of unknown function (DUF4279)
MRLFMKGTVSNVPTYFMSDRGTYILANREARAKLTILSDEIPAAEISRRLGIDADESWRRGELAGRGRSGRRHPHHGWTLTSGLSDDASTNEHLGALVARLEPVAAELRKLATQPGITAKLWLFEHIENWNPGLWLPPDQLASLARIGIGLAVDIYVYEPGELAPVQIPRRVPTRPKGA